MWPRTPLQTPIFQGLREALLSNVPNYPWQYQIAAIIVFNAWWRVHRDLYDTRLSEMNFPKTPLRCGRPGFS